MERVASVSANVMSWRVGTASQASSEYLVHRGQPLTNTFLNFIAPGGEEDEQPKLIPRRHSFLSYVPATWDSEHSTRASERDHDEDVMEAVTSTETEHEEEEEDDEEEDVVCSLAHPSARGSSSIHSNTFAGHEALGSMPSSSSSASFEAAHEMVEADMAGDSGAFTTLMITNLPESCTQTYLRSVLDNEGYFRTYNFCHAPIEFDTGRCYGYAFINFRAHDAARSFLNAWHRSPLFCSAVHNKRLVVTISKYQGLTSLVAQLSMKKLRRVKNPAFRPYIARDARHVLGY